MRRLYEFGMTRARRGFVVLRRGRRACPEQREGTWAQDERFLSVASQILHFVQDDKTRVRMSPNPCYSVLPGAVAVAVAELFVGRASSLVSQGRARAPDLRRNARLPARRIRMPGGAGRRPIPIYPASLLPSVFSASLRLCARYNSFPFKPLRSLAQAFQTAALRERERPSTRRTDRVWRLSGYQRRRPSRTEGWPKADNPLRTPLGACRNHKSTQRPDGPGV